MSTPVQADATAAGHAALTRGDWDEARVRFEEALAADRTPEALEGLSWAAWWQNDAPLMFQAREEAYRLYRSQGDAGGAARMAMWIGTDHVDFRGERAVGQGWLARARRLLEGLAPSEEHGWLWVHEAEKLVAAHETAKARELAQEAAELGRRLGAVDLEMMALATEGLALVTEGASEEGIARLDEAAAAVFAGELAERWASSWCLCYMIYACERARDMDRAAQWCKRVEAWAEEKGTSPVGPSCRAHYGGVLIWRGSWAEAEQTLQESAERLTEIRPPMAAEAMVRLGELRRRQGRLDEAAKLFEDVAEHPLALLGLGAIALDRGDPAVARDRALAYLRDTPPTAGTERAAGLELLIRAQAELGHDDGMAAALDELERLASMVSTDPLTASARLAAGLVAAAVGDQERARETFEDATRLFHRTGAPFEAARARIELARALASDGRLRDGLREAKAAATSLRRIGATGEAERAESLVRELGQPGDSSPITSREREVLALVAQGMGDRAIAERLVLSEHTVHRHVANILRKLGCASRSAAVAEAVRKGWA